MKRQTNLVSSDDLKELPPLTQSRHGDMACETLYVRKHVAGVKLGESEPAARGTEIHQVLATYLNHFVRTRRASDLEAFDALMKGAGSEAREVLEKFRDNHAFDPEKILATELHIALDKDFQPICLGGRWRDPDGTGARPAIPPGGVCSMEQMSRGPRKTTTNTASPKKTTQNPAELAGNLFSKNGGGRVGKWTGQKVKRVAGAWGGGWGKSKFFNIAKLVI